MANSLTIEFRFTQREVDPRLTDPRKAMCALHIADRNSPFINLENFVWWLGFAGSGAEYLPRALTFDALHGGFQHIEFRSVSPQMIWLEHGLEDIEYPPYDWEMARPPFAEIINDWLRFISDEDCESFTKTYTWKSVDFDAASGPGATEARAESETVGPTMRPKLGPVTVSFTLDRRRPGDDLDPTARSDQTDRRGLDYLFELFQLLSNGRNTLVMSDFLTRETFSFWTSWGAIRADETTAMIWADPDADEDDYLLMSRSQFEAIWRDFRQFAMQLKPVTRTYEPDTTSD